MKRAIAVEKVAQIPIEERDIEIVERKGRGHPDYIADGVSEAVSRALCRYYLKEFGTVLHHNVDKSLIVGGKAHTCFGGGEVDEPFRVIVAGRAVTQILKNGELRHIPIGNIALTSMREFLKENFRFLNIGTDVVVDYMIKQGSVDLIENFQNGEDMPHANDTSFGVGYAPLSETERIVLESELFLNSPKCKKELPEIGEDIKVMGLRRNHHFNLTIAAPQISSLTPDLEHYLSIKEEIKHKIEDLASKITKYPVNIHVNMADNLKKEIVYLTVTGTSAEHGDDGNTGRGNRVNGLITPCRPMSLEATAGKNPVNHVGKIYNVLAINVAETIYKEVGGIREVYVKILSQIGKPIDQPLSAAVEVLLEDSVSLQKVRGDIEGIVDEKLASIKKVTEAIIEGKATLF